MENSIKDKVVIVTGASRGIGRAIALAFGHEGASVCVNYNSNQAKANEVVAQIKSYGSKAIAVKADMSDEGEVIEMVTQTEKMLGKIDVLVNNAAVCPTGPLVSYTKSDWEKTFATNVTGVFIATREVVSRMLDDNRKGAIINIASQAAFLGSTSGHLPYDSSKGAMVSFTIGLAREVSSKGIRVNGVAPGLVRTEMVAEAWEAKKEKYLARIPINRIAEPEEIASVVLFLASDAASYITGSTIDVTGGMIMR